MKSAVKWLHIEFQKRFPKETNEMYNNNQFDYEDMIIKAKEMEKEEKLKVQIEENESVLQMLRLHGNDSSVMRVFLRLESLKQTFKSE